MKNVGSSQNGNVTVRQSSLVIRRCCSACVRVKHLHSYHIGGICRLFLIALFKYLISI
eukprot:jgi/Bigna1/64114/fgenesh1_kg.67_\